VCGIAHDAGDALLPVCVWFVDPQAPGPDLLPDLEVLEDVSV
jgi:hypothetical protein